MKFFVILICITANFFWRRDYDRISDKWFENFRALIASLISKFEVSDDRYRMLGLLAIFLLPMLVLALLLLLVEGVFLGLLTIIIHILILLMAFDRIHPSMMANEYLRFWHEKNLDGCYLYLEKLINPRPVPHDYQGLHDAFRTHFVYSCFEKMFVMFFCYLIAGPVAVLFAYICYQYRDGDVSERGDKEINLVNKLIELIEWAPLRLLGLTLILVGNFDKGIARLKQTDLVNRLDTDVTLFEYTNSSLGLEPSGESESDISASQSSAVEPDFDEFRTKVVNEIGSLQALLERSQIAWVCAIALIIVLMYSV